jgi:hypothetical protein
MLDGSAERNGGLSAMIAGGDFPDTHSRGLASCDNAGSPSFIDVAVKWLTLIISRGFMKADGSVGDLSGRRALL